MSSNTVKTLEIKGSSFENIKKVQGAEKISSEYSHNLIDESKIPGGSADFLFYPSTESDIVSIVKKMRELKTPITISGAKTGLVGGAVPYKGAIISTELMDKTIGLGYDEKVQKYFVKLQPGVILKDLEEKIKYKEFTEEDNLSKDYNYVLNFKSDEQLFELPIIPTETSASIGGVVAVNSSGAMSFKYGPYRPWIRKIRVILDSGEILDIKRGQYKAQDGKFIIQKSNCEVIIDIPTYRMPEAKNAGGIFTEPEMDLIDLFIGTEGIFGIISEVDIWIKETVTGLPNVMFFLSENDSIVFMEKLRENKELDAEYIEFFDENSFNLLKSRQKTNPALANLKTIPEEAKTAIFFEIPYSEETLENIIIKIEEMAIASNSSIDLCWSASTEEEKENFRAIRHAIPEIIHNIIAKRKSEFPYLRKIGTDMSVTDSHFREMMKIYHEELRKNNLEYIMYGHIGDNHIHVDILPKDMKELELGEKLYKYFAVKAVEFDGSVAAEHGIGKIKHDYLVIMFGKEGVAQMKKIKTTLDPNGLFNRDNLFPWRQSSSNANTKLIYT